MAGSPQHISVTQISSTINKSGHEIAKEQASGEIVFGFAGAIGCGIKDVVAKMAEYLEAANYEVHLISISDIIKNLYKSGIIDLPEHPDIDIDSLTGKERYTILQDCGNKLRESFNPSFLADAVISEIATLRKAISLKESGEEGEYVRRAYLVNQFKNPEEIKTLRLLYGDSFFLTGVLSSTNDRLKNLRRERIDELDARTLVERDKGENEDHGQRLQKTLFNADYFIRHTNNNVEDLSIPIERFIKLIHGQKGVTPTLQEIGMFEAYTASLSSACLSRQVGAAIADEEGTIISSGCNDAPASGGGLYTADHASDLRCYRKGEICYNYEKQKELLQDITQIIQQHDIEEDKAKEIAANIKKNTRVSSLTEFSRAIHAEMDAILKIARRDSTSTRNCTLYTTTYPCHNCARHIVAAGISRVVYIEPYEKSLALELHDDAITTDDQDAEQDLNNSLKKLLIVQFEGTAPIRYESFFKYKKGTKVGGKLHKTPIGESQQLDPLFAEAYHQIEKRILKNFNDIVTQEVETGEADPAA